MITINIDYNKESCSQAIEPYVGGDYSSVLVQIFTYRCDEAFLSSLLLEIHEILPHAIIIGATTDGEIIGNLVQTNSTVLSVTFFQTSTLRLYSMPYVHDTTTSYEKGVSLGLWCKKGRPQAVIAFADGLNTNADNFLKGFGSILSHTVIAGGLAGDGATFSGTFVCSNEGVFPNGIVAVAIDGDDLNIACDYGFGWIPIEKEMEVTHSVENHIFTIDNIPADEIYSYYLGEAAGSKLPAIGIEFPLIIHENGFDIARAVLARKEDGSLIFAGNIPKGSHVRFGVANVKGILHDSKKLLRAMESYPVQTIFAYSCMARRRFLGDDASLEFRELSDIAPIAGFCTYGEFYHSWEGNSLFNQTTTLLALWEGEGNIASPLAMAKKIETPHSLGTLKALTHLINVVTHDLLKANHEIEEQSKIMLMQSRFSAMGEMIGNIAHQWRQPLSVLALEIQDIEEAFYYGELDKSYLEKFSHKSMYQIKYMSKTIDDFRSFLNPSRAEGSFFLDELFVRLYTLLESVLSAHSITFTCSNEVKSLIKGDSNQLLQVLVNLINNAKDAQVSTNVVDKKIFLTAINEEKNLLILVQDNGGGIPEAILERIFEPYFTTKEVLHGSGLGLYMSRLMIEQKFNGSIHVSNNQEGACFSIRIPMNSTTTEKEK